MRIGGWTVEASVVMNPSGHQKNPLAWSLRVVGISLGNNLRRNHIV